MDFLQKLLLAFLKAFLNTLLSFLFGILQIAVVYFLSEMSDDRTFNLNGFYDTGFFFFFTVAIISSALVEYYLDARVQTNVYFNAFILISCMVTSIFCMVGFSKIFLQIDTTNKEVSVLIQDVSLIFAGAVSILLKLILYFKRP